MEDLGLFLSLYQCKLPEASLLYMLERKKGKKGSLTAFPVNMCSITCSP